MFKPVEVKALEPYRIWLRYEGGTEGEMGLSDLAGWASSRPGRTVRFSGTCRVGKFGEIVWRDEMDLIAPYMRLTGKSPGELFRSARRTRAGA